MNNENGMDTVAENKISENLFQALLEELSAYEYLSEVMEEKKQAIISNNLPQIEHLSGTEQLIVAKANRLTEARYNLMLKYFKTQNIDGAPITLSAFIELVAQNEQSAWEKIDRRLSRTLEQIKRTNLENKHLLETSLKYVQGMINLFLPQEENLNDIYNPKGSGNGKVTVKNLLDCNA